MTDTTDPQTDPGERLESIRRALAVVAADRPTPEQIAGWNTADRGMAQRIRAALPGVPLHHAYAVLQALRVTQRLDADAAQPPASAPSAPADRAGLLDAAAQAIRDSNGSPEALEWWRTHPQLIPAHVYAAAVLSVLPPAAERGAVLREAADRIEVLTNEAYERALSEDEIGYANGLENAMKELRRLAAGERDEQQGGPETRTVKCTRAVLRQPHTSHGWQPQPGMDFVNCPGASGWEYPAPASVAGQPPADTGEEARS